MFIDAPGDIYEIDHSKKFARLVAHQSPLLHEILRQIGPENNTSLGHETVSGFECLVVPVLSGPSTEAKPHGILLGKEYLYLPYGLRVKSESTNPEGSLLTIHERYDIQVAEPDPALVRIPEGYFIDNTLQRQ
jgi:hypothetical protein